MCIWVTNIPLSPHPPTPTPVPGEFPAQRPVTRSFDVFLDLRLNKRLSKQSRRQWIETPSRSSWRHCNVRQDKWTCVCFLPVTHERQKSPTSRLFAQHFVQTENNQRISNVFSSAKQSTSGKKHRERNILSLFNLLIAWKSTHAERILGLQIVCLVLIKIAVSGVIIQFKFKFKSFIDTQKKSLQTYES